MSSEIVFLYDQVIEQLARLQAFCSMRMTTLAQDTDVEEDVESLLSILAKRDLLILAASTRNFADSCDSVSRMKNVNIKTSKILNAIAPPYLTDSEIQVSLYKCLSRVLHARSVRILRTKMDFDVLFATISDDPIQSLVDRGNIHLNDHLLDPAIVLLTKDDGAIVVLLSRALAAVHKFMHSEAEQLVARKIYVSQSLRQL